MIDRNHPTKPGDRTVLEVESSHHIHGTSCLCGFQSLTARERTEHITRRALNAFAHDPKSADDLRDTPAGRALMAEAWSKFQEHYATEWEEAYPEDIFPSPAPSPAVVSRESVAAFMMRQWAKNLRADHNPFEEGE